MNFSQEIWVVLTAATPISEIRGALPLGIVFFGMHPLKAYLLSVFGNLLPILPLLFFLNYLADFMMRKIYFVNRFLSWLFEHTRKRHDSHFHYWGWAPLALFVFVAIPFPLTGAWSGTVASFVFGVPIKKAFFIISLGVFAAGVLVLGFTNLGVKIFNL